ncbi:MAG: glycosyltransferase involved in cell wall biosynthesis [Parvicella sp.]|jgi:glycosyltransferase involved in cell wall biosynthesis
MGRNKKVQIFIATRDRIQSLKGAIDSILSQSYKDFEVIVSDNSTNDITQFEVTKNYSGRVTYRRRDPPVGALDHFNQILAEVSSDYFMVFHDDDEMYPDMINTLGDFLDENKSFCAVGSGADCMKGGKEIRTRFYSSRTVKFIQNSSELVLGYFINVGMVPFPSYMYRKAVAETIRFDIEKGGKYCDVAFLMDVADFGKLAYLPQRLMVYNFHADQDSYTNNLIDRSRLVTYISKKTTHVRGKGAFKKYRLRNLYSEVAQRIRIGDRIPMKVLIFMILISSCSFEYLLKLTYHFLSRKLNLN